MHSKLTYTDEHTIIAILEQELIPAAGCTEPIAIAYASAVAKKHLSTFPISAHTLCSKNIIKNVQSVVVPSSGGRKGVAVSTILGLIVGKSEAGLEILNHVTEEHRIELERLLNSDFCTTGQSDSKESLHIQVSLVGEGGEYVEVEIAQTHTNIIRIEHNGIHLPLQKIEVSHSEEIPLSSYSILDMNRVITFTKTVEIEKVKPIIQRQIDHNLAIAEAGFTHSYGIGIAKSLQDMAHDDPYQLGKAYAGSASEARMNGCELSVITNSGSGNQGITASLPIIIFAKETHKTEEELIRALVLSNLIAIRIKAGIGRLSAFCGAVSAACGTAVAYTYLSGGTHQQIIDTLKNIIGNVSGIICDGAKTGCALKIVSSVDAAIVAHKLAMKSIVLEDNSGILKSGIEETLSALERLGREGMAETDNIILSIMQS
ncbi:MAG: serine dehydratase subunit alpha family protein [Spirochaetia bacterium]|nr:serine dehydratase subunit alpha family protein [Spirochaetia bacterium]